MRAVDENAFDNGFGTQQYMDGESNVNGTLLPNGDIGILYAPIGGGGGGVSTGGGGVVATSNTIGTANYNSDFQFNVRSNIDGAAIVVNGENTYKTTNGILTYALTDIISTTSKKITIEKQGYTSNEYYLIDVVENPEFKMDILSGINININPYDSLINYQNRNLPNWDYSNTAPVFSNVPAYTVRVRKFVNDSQDITYTYNPTEQTRNIEFELLNIPTQEFPVDPLETSKFSISLDGPNSSVTLVINPNSSNPEFLELTNGVTQLDYPIGTEIKIQTSNLELYRVKTIELSSESQSKVVEASSDIETISTIINLDRTVNLNIVSQTFSIEQKLIPRISFVNSDDLSKKYNKNTKTDYPIGIVKSSNTEKITAFIGSETFVFSNLGNSTSAIVILPARVFTKIGVYRVILKPSNIDGDGETIEFNLNVVDDVYVGVPDIRNISYPAVLRGPDFAGTNVDFKIAYDSINTDYVRLFIENDGPSTTGTDTNYIQIGKSGNQTFNFGDLLSLGNVQTFDEDDIINLTIKLVPYNISGREVVKGKTEIITIQFDKGDLTIPRDVAVSRIADGFITQFDLSIFEDETSKYLTHLLHLGNGDNKVITTWVGDNNSLILKLYEPLTTNIQPNQQVWISKIQANPIVETITISGIDTSFCPPLQGPNFSLNPDNGIGYQVFEDLIASGSITSTDVLNEVTEQNSINTEKLNIQYVSGSVENGWDYSFENFIHFGSAEERVNNFFYKIKLLESYKDKYNKLIADTFIPPYDGYVGGILAEDDSVNPIDITLDGAQLITDDELFDIQWEVFQFKGVSQKAEADRVALLINNLLKSFDGFEKYLYKSENDLAYPKETYTNPISGLSYRVLKSSTNSTVTNWFESLVYAGASYDKDNVYSMKNNMPEHIIEDYQNDEFILFLDMIGQHFDILWAYINGLKSMKLLEHKQEIGISNEFVYNLLGSLGWEGKRAFNSQYLWEYMFGTDRNGVQKYNTSLKDANNEVWRRILNNLPYLLKHKGTQRALKAAMACYGVPQSMLTIMEFGGPQDPTKGGSTKFTFDDRTAAIVLDETSRISVPWHIADTSGDYPNCIEFRIKPSEITPVSTLISNNEFSLDLIQTTGSFGKLELNFGGNDSTSTYFETGGLYYPYVSTAIEYVYGPDLKTGSLDFPISTEHYSNVVINRHNYFGGTSLYEIWFGTSDGTRILTSVSMSMLYNDDQWETGSTIIVGGDGFVGNLDEFRLWTVPLLKTKFNNHTLFPDAINGNSHTGSTSDLIFRLDFEYPKDRTITENLGIKNVAINTTYDEPFASASYMYSASAYPYQYEPYDRTVTATVPSLGMNYSNKIRFEEQTLVGDLSYKARATEKAFDRAPIDSNRLGLFFSPIKELNMDILRAFGDFNIDNYIGDPSDEYKNSYKELDKLREYYFERLERNIYEYIQLVRYIDKSLFDVLHDLSPARAKVSKGLLIEPHYLERSKTKWDKPIAQYDDLDTSINTNQNYILESTYDVEDANLDLTEATTLISEVNNYETLLNTSDIYTLDVTNDSFESKIDYYENVTIIGDAPFYEASIQCPTGSSLSGEADSFKFEEIGMDKNSIANAGFGLYSKHGTGIVRTIEPVFGNFQLTGSRQNIYLIKEQYTQRINVQVTGYPTTRSLTVPGEQVTYAKVPITKYRYKVSTLPYSGSVTPDSNIVEITALNGYFPTHYKFVNNLSEGLQRSYFKGSLQTALTTPDGLDAVETFTTNPNILRVAKTGRGSGEPILEVD